MSFPLRLKENDVTIKTISRQIAIHFLQQSVKESSLHLAKNWEDLKQRVNEAVTTLSQ